MTHTMQLQPLPFEMIRNGTKTIELRLYDEKRRKIRVGDDIVFALAGNPGETLRVRVTGLYVFDSFAALYGALPLLECGYTQDDLETASPKDMDLYYSAEAQRKYGAVGIRIEPAARAEEERPGTGVEYRRIGTSRMEALWKLQKLYKAEIGEDEPGEAEKERLSEAIEDGRIFFFGAFDKDALVGCCSVTAGFSTFDYRAGGVFEDFYILPGYRHQGIARKLVRFARRESGVSSLTVGCADCDVEMYRSLGFSVPVGNLLAYGGPDGEET